MKKATYGFITFIASQHDTIDVDLSSVREPVGNRCPLEQTPAVRS